MGLGHKIMRALEIIKPSQYVFAHCDVPCGIYDPHQAQIAAHTVFRMTQLIKENENDTHKIARFTSVKEEHAELCKKEIRIIWGDYFKPEHLEKFPQLHTLVWEIMKTASTTKQNVDSDATEKLLEKVMEFSEIFWKSKNIETFRTIAPYPTEKNIVYPKVC